MSTCTPNDARKRKMITLTLAPESIAYLDELHAKHPDLSRSVIVDKLLASNKAMVAAKATARAVSPPHKRSPPGDNS